MTEHEGSFVRNLHPELILEEIPARSVDAIQASHQWKEELRRRIRFPHHFGDPSDVIRQSRVNAELATFSATLAEAGDTEDRPWMIGLFWIPAQKRTAAVARARIHSPTSISGAEHVVRYSVIYIDTSTDFAGNDWNLKRKIIILIIEE